jgi:hypothetical protein
MPHKKFLSYIGRTRANGNFPCTIANRAQISVVYDFFSIFQCTRGKKVLFAGYPREKASDALTA